MTRAARVVWAGEGRNAQVLEGFYDELGRGRCARLQAISLDLGGAYQKATNTKAPHVRQCADPFHVIKLANEAIDKTRRLAWNQARQTPAVKRGRGRPRSDAPAPPRDASRWVKHTRWALVKDPDQLKPSQLDVLHELRRSNSVLYRCWQLKEGLRDLYRLADPTDAASPPATGGWPGPAAVASPPSSPCPRPSGPTATGSWQPSSSACPTPSSRASTAKSG